MNTSIARTTLSSHGHCRRVAVTNDKNNLYIAPGSSKEQPKSMVSMAFFFLFMGVGVFTRGGGRERFGGCFSF